MDRAYFRPLFRAATVAAAITLSACALCGCGGQPPAVPGVASIPATGTSGGPASSSSAGPDGSTQPGGDGGSGRPQFRLDDTAARDAALVNAYNECLIGHGATKGGRNLPTPEPSQDTEIITAENVPPAAKAACLHLLPLMPPELEAATNPDFHEQSLAYVDCMQKQGLWVQLLNSYNIDWTFVGGHPAPENFDQISHDCQLQAFGHK
jgi:hypothetical protein